MSAGHAGASLRRGLLLALASAMGCAVTHSPVAFASEPDAPPALVAEYRLEHFEGKSTKPAEAGNWRMWREPHRLWRESVDKATSEQWQLDGRTLFHTRYFHEYRAGVEFQHGDLAMLGALPAWKQLTLLVAPELLAALPVTERGERDGHRWRRHQGDREGVRWNILWREDLQLPEMLERETGGELERQTLIGSWPLADAPWTRQSAEAYRVIEFADLGDNERDPLVQKIQGRLGVAHGHTH